MRLSMFLFCFLGALQAAASLQSDDVRYDPEESFPSYDHPIVAVYRASRSTEPVQSGAFDSLDVSLPYPAIMPIVNTAQFKNLLIMAPKQFHLLPDYLRMETPEMRQLYAIIVVLWTTWTNVRGLLKTFCRDSIFFMAVVALIVALVYVKYNVLQSYAPNHYTGLTMTDAYFFIVDLFLDFSFYFIQCIFTFAFNRRVKNGALSSVPLAIEPNRFNGLLKKSMDDDRYDATVSMLEWASKREQIREDTDGVFFQTLDQLLRDSKMTNSLQNRVLRVLFSCKTSLTAEELTQYPCIAWWLRLSLNLYEVEAIHKKAYLLKDSPDVEFGKDLRNTLVSLASRYLFNTG